MKSLTRSSKYPISLLESKLKREAELRELKDHYDLCFLMVSFNTDCIVLSLVRLSKLNTSKARLANNIVCEKKA